MKFLIIIAFVSQILSLSFSSFSDSITRNSVSDSNVKKFANKLCDKILYKLFKNGNSLNSNIKLQIERNLKQVAPEIIKANLKSAQNSKSISKREEISALKKAWGTAKNTMEELKQAIVSILEKIEKNFEKAKGSKLASSNPEGVHADYAKLLEKESEIRNRIQFINEYESRIGKLTPSEQAAADHYRGLYTHIKAEKKLLEKHMKWVNSGNSIGKMSDDLQFQTLDVRTKKMYHDLQSYQSLKELLEKELAKFPPANTLSGPELIRFQKIDAMYEEALHAINSHTNGIIGSTNKMQILLQEISSYKQTILGLVGFGIFFLVIFFLKIFQEDTQN